MIRLVDYRDGDNATYPRHGDSYEIFHLLHRGRKLGLVALKLTEGSYSRSVRDREIRELHYVQLPKKTGDFGRLTRRRALVVHRGERLPIGSGPGGLALHPVTQGEASKLRLTW